MPPPDLPFADFLDQAGVSCSDGSFVTARAMRVVEIIRDYDPQLDVEWIPRERRQPGDNSIRIVDNRAHGLARVIMSFVDEEEFTRKDGADVLERLFLADWTRHDPIARMDAANAAAKALELHRTMERVEETKDIGRHALASPLHSYTARDPATGEKKVYE
jgi:hypothetical protein